MNAFHVPRSRLRESVGVRVACVIFLTLFSFTALAGSRHKPGGTLSIALVSPAASVNPLSADAPVDAFRLSLTHQPLCKLVDFSRPTPATLRLSANVEPKLVLEALSRGGALTAQVGAIAVNSRDLDLTLKSAAPELEKTLCHPVFSIAVAPFKTNGNKLEAFIDQPLGRPYLDALTLTATDARGAERFFAQRRVHAIAGSSTATGAPQLFVTALVLGPDSTHLRAALEGSVDREQLARLFVPAPSSPLYGLLPDAAAPTPSAKPAALTTPRELTLLFDATAEHEKALAQRLQVKLQPFGYRVALKPVPRSQLKSAPLAAGEFALRSFALAPSASGALLVWLQLAGQGNRAASLLPQLDTMPRELAAQLGRELPVVPLVARGLGVTVTNDVQHLTFDAMGLPRFDDVFLGAD